MARSKHITSIAGAFFVTMLWSSSYVLIKIGLQDISPLVFASFRYMLAGLILSTRVLLSADYRREVIKLSSKWWLKLSIYGFLYYTVTQGTQFVGLFYLQAITVSFMLNLTSIIVLILGIMFLREHPSSKQILLLIIGFSGVFLFFYPINLSQAQFFGIIVMGIGVVANALSSIIGRSLNRVKQVSPIVITTISMMMGSIILLGSAIILEGFPKLAPGVIILILWLAIVNTAIAFVIWNYTLQELTAIESSIINSTMLPQITILAIIFFSEHLILKEWVGLVLIFITGLLISLVRKKEINIDNNATDDISITGAILTKST